MTQYSDPVTLQGPAGHAAPTTTPIRSRGSWFERMAESAALVRVLSVAVVVALWQLIGHKYPYTTSSPSAVIHALVRTFGSDIAPAFRNTIETLGLGLAICVVVGIPLGLALERSRLMALIVEPYAVMLFSIPFIALFPVLILEFGISFWLRVACIVITGLFPIVLNTATGARQVDPAYHDVGRSFVASRTRTIFGVILPGSARFIFAGLRIGFARGMIGAVVVELEASAVGVGSLMQRNIQHLQLANFFAALLLLGVFALACTWLIAAGEQWFTEPWERRISFARATSSGGGVWDTAVDSTVPVLRRALAPLARAWSAITRASAPRVRGRLAAWIVRLLTLAAIVGLWYLRAQTVNRAVLPDPRDVAKAGWRQIFTSHELWGPLGTSFEVLVVGFLASVVIGVPVGIAMGRWKLIERVVDPYVSFLYALPHVAFVPIMIVWLGFYFKFRVAYVIVSAVFVVIVNTMSGVKSVDPNLVETGRSFCASESKILRSIIIPGAIPLTLAGTRLAFSACWVGVVVSEILSTNSGLGGLITTYSDEYRTADMFVPIIAIMVIAVLLLEASTWAEQRILPWRRKVR